MRMVALDADSMGSTGPTLPVDFPPHLLLRICETILAPLLSPCSPLKPYSKPWSRSASSPWHNLNESTSTKRARFYGGSSNWATGASNIGSCKNDLLGFATSSKRMWSICGEMVYRHVRLTNLAIGDILVSRRNLLKHTRVLEMYITREVESSQAQTDLNLSRFFIQAGVILLWSPSLHTILLDIKSVPADQYVWSSFLSRLRQRLFIDEVPGLGTNIQSAPRFPPTSAENTITRAGNELSTSRDSTARWGDSQGAFQTPDRVSIPNFAMGMGYTAAGEVERGFGGLLDMLFSPQFPIHRSASGTHAPSAIISGTKIKSPSIGRLDALTSLDLLIPRPSWGHEESEGFALGLTLRRLGGLKRLGLHADGVIQNNSTNFTGFGLKRKPPFGNTEVDADESEEEDADMAVDETGIVIYPTTRSHSQAEYSQSISASGSVINHGYGTQHDGGYGPETWWAGVLNALTYSPSDLEDPEHVYPIAEQSLEEFRVSVSVPGGNVELLDFDAFFYLVLPYIHKMIKLQVLVFDMGFPVPQEQPYQSWSTEGRPGTMALFDRQRHYVEKLVDPNVPSNPLVPSKSTSPHSRSTPQQFAIPISTAANGTRSVRARTLDSIDPESSLATDDDDAGSSVAATVIETKAPTYSKSIKHVYFGEYHGLPNLAPPDPYDRAISPEPSGGIQFATLPDLGKDGLELKDKSPPTGDGGKDKSKWSRISDKDSTQSTSVINMDNQRIVPGMWWTIDRSGYEELEIKSSDEAEVGLLSKTSTGNKRVSAVVQGWEEVQ